MDVKSSLKEAREAIKNKDYKTSLKLSKGIVKEDKTNYMGLVFLGISLQEIGPTEQAPLAFRKAIELNSSNLLAWNGIANYYEKSEGIESKAELVSIYKTICELEINEQKIIETLRKLCGLQSDDYKIVVDVLQAAINSEKISETLKFDVYKMVGQYLNRISRICPSVTDFHEQSFIKLLENSETASEDIYFDYIKLLRKLKKYDNFFTEGEKMHALYKSNVALLKIQCQVYNELMIEENPLCDDVVEKINNYKDLLLQHDPQSTTALLTKCFFLYTKNDLIEIKDILTNVTRSKPFLQSWMLLTRCYLDLQFYSDAITSGHYADKLLKPEDSILRKKLAVYMCQCMSRYNENNDWDTAINLCLVRLNDTPSDSKVITSLIQAYINKKDCLEAEMWLEKLQDDTRHLMAARIFKARGNIEKALDVLEGHPVETYEHWMEIGFTYWIQEKFDKTLVPFLKALKLNQNSYECFLHLGNYYQKIGDFDKARRCYEKSFKINRKCTAAGVEMSRMYRKLKKWDENFVLLQEITSGKIDVNSKWAYLELGILCLEKEDYKEAVNSLRLVIRLDPENGHCWDSLGDAYLARGSFTSALKSYQRASELLPNSLYSLLQAANIKKILSEFVEARKEFENVLQLDKLYTPALKGIAETCMWQARQFRTQQLNGLSRDCAQYALDKVTLALRDRSDLSCLWKIAADCFMLVAGLPPKYCCLLTSAALAEGVSEDRNVILEQDELYTVASRCYSKAITLIDENILMYQDLANCYLAHAKITPDAEKKQELLEKAQVVVQHCTTSNPTHWQHWNLMGNIAFFREPKNLTLAQHAFIKALTQERNCAEAWCNLGCVYLHAGDVRLANDAFSQAQRSDPNYVNSWVGQALIAEAAGHEDAMDLFRHTTQLSHQSQGALGYAHWVCTKLMELPINKTTYCIHNMHAIPVACDALTWYTENNPDDSCAWNMLGLLRERMGLKTDTWRAFRSSLMSSTKNKRDHINMNYGRALMNLGKHSEAVKVYKDVLEATFNSGSGLALALFKDKQYEESYEAYEAALHWLTEKEEFQSDLLVALASMVYLFQGPDPAKTLLLQSINLQPRSSWGLYATLSFGLLQNDLNLALLVLKELEVMKDYKDCLPHYATLLTYTHFLQGENTKAVRELCKLIHRHPDQASLWLFLSILLLRLHDERPVTSAAAKCASVAMKLGQSKMDVSKVLCIVSLASLVCNDYKKSIKAAQSAIHYYPDVKEGWCVLISALKNLEGHKLKVTDFKKHVLTHLRPTKTLENWLCAC